MQDGILVATIKTHSLSEYESRIVGDQILADAETSGRIILDLEEVTFMASAGVGMIVKVHNRAKQAGGKLAVCNLNDQLVELMRITRIDKLFPIEESLEKAKQKV